MRLRRLYGPGGHRTMHATRLLATGDIRTVNLPVPTPGPGEVLVRVLAAGICGTDRHLFKGEFPCAPPVTLGHEFSGEVAVTGDGVTLALGTRIACDPNIACGACDACLRGRVNLCARNVAIGIHRDGGLADYAVIPAHRALPIGDLDPHHAAFAEPLACTRHGLDRGAPRPGERVPVIGGGVIGLLAVQLAASAGAGTDMPRFVATPMLRGALTEIAGQPAASVRTRGPEATFLLAGEVPLTYRSQLPASSRITAGEWWAADHTGPALVSLHQSLRSGLGVDLGDTLTFTIFGEPITASIASFRDYSWQGGIDFLATFSPGVIDQFPTTLFAAVTALPGREEAVERRLAADFPDIRFIAIGDTLKQITDALSQLSFAAVLVGGLAVGNGLLVLVGSLATGRRQREADTVISKVLGATRLDLLATAFMQYLVLATLAALPAIVLGIGLGWLVSMLMLNVDFTVNADALAVVLLVALAITACLGAMTILRAASARPARLLRDL